MNKLLIFILAFLSYGWIFAQSSTIKKTGMKTEKEWKETLTSEEYRVLREKGTEAPNSGIYNLHFDNGQYLCNGCKSEIFHSDSKFKSSCGWPSFDQAIKGKIVEKKDFSYGMIRTEILCSNCDGHLGHVFNDGPTDTGIRYCINSISMDFIKDD
jgi:peptide-methionine (R)-S-oxide reductase